MQKPKHVRKGWHILSVTAATAAGFALVLAACAPSAVAPTVSALGTQLAPTVQAAGTSVATQASGLGTTLAPTVQAAGTTLATEASGLATTLAPTVQAAGTSIATQASGLATTLAPTVQAAGTTLATQASGLGTSVATQLATPAPTEQSSAATANATVAANAPLLIESDKLLGMNLQDTSGSAIGPIRDVLVDSTGAVKGLVVDDSAYLGSSAAATPTANGTAATATTVVVPWSDIQVDPTRQAIIYTGSKTALASLPALDESKISSGFVIRTQGTNLPATYDGLIHLGGSLSSLNLQTPANQKLGSVQNVIIDLHSGQAPYAVVDFGGFLGLAQQSILVPWTKISLDNSDPTATNPVLRLNVTQSGLQTAPKFDPSQLSLWPTPSQPNWDSQIKQFWQQIAG